MDIPQDIEQQIADVPIDPWAHLHQEHHVHIVRHVLTAMERLPEERSVPMLSLEIKIIDQVEVPVLRLIIIAVPEPIVRMAHHHPLEAAAPIAGVAV